MLREMQPILRTSRFFNSQILHRKNTSISSEGKTHEGVLTKIFQLIRERKKTQQKHNTH